MKGTLRVVPRLFGSIYCVAEHMVELAHEHAETIKYTFKGIDLYAAPCDTAYTIVRIYLRELHRSYVRECATIKWQRLEGKWARENRAKQCCLDTAMPELSSLDFACLADVINWLGKIQGPSEIIGVRVPNKEIVATFRNHGFEPNVNYGRNFNEEDEDNHARWLIGQALVNLEDRGAIHKVFDRFADEWRKKFGHKKEGAMDHEQHSSR